MTGKNKNYSWVTNDMFTRKLEEVLAEIPATTILHIPGVYELVAEDYNNYVLRLLEDEREEK